MACKLYFPFLVLFITTVFASARVPRIVENHEASLPMANTMDDGNQGGKLKTDCTIPVPSPNLPSLDRGGKMETDGESTPTETDGSGTARPGSLPIGMIPVIRRGDGSFQFGIGLGPIGFGFGFGWGGITPGYPQPYIVVSPYTGPFPIPGAPYFPPGVPFMPPAPYIPPIPYQPPTGSSPNVPPMPEFGTGEPARAYGTSYPPSPSPASSASEPKN